MTDTLEKDFKFFIPLTKAKTSGDSGVRIVEGIASTNDLDLQNERVIQKGIDYSYFLKHGYLNWDHQKGAENKIGEPWECRLTRKGLYIKGMLYKGKQVADAVWEHITALKKNPKAIRRVGFSLEGKTLLKKSNSILRCWVKDIAITAAPINYNTYLDVVKSLSSYDISSDFLAKTLAAGNSVSGQTGGRAIIPESGISGRREEEEEEGDERRGLVDVEYGGEHKLTKGNLSMLIRHRLGYSRKTSDLLSDILFDLS